MNPPDITSEKTYYPIGEVAKMFNLTVSNVRFWEQEFPVLKPKKNRKGDRFFTRKDLEWLKVIYHLLKEEGYTIEGARKKLAQSSKGVSDRVEIINSLRKVKGFLVSMKETIDQKRPEKTVEAGSVGFPPVEIDLSSGFSSEQEEQRTELGETIVDESGIIKEADDAESTAGSNDLFSSHEENTTTEEPLKEENEEPF